MPTINVLEQYCKGCSLCINTCPKSVLSMGNEANNKGYYYVTVINPTACIGCGLCGMICPDVALEIYK